MEWGKKQLEVLARPQYKEVKLIFYFGTAHMI